MNQHMGGFTGDIQLNRQIRATWGKAVLVDELCNEPESLGLTLGERLHA
jgi:hypothetical protein